MNKTSAIEWLEKSWHNLSAAKILYEANHYTDITAVELHYAFEKSLKAFLAYENKKIPKSHDLIEIYNLVDNFINLDEYFILLKQITKYHIESSYPTFDRVLPSREEIKEVLEFTQYIFTKICNILNINIEEVRK